MYRQAKYECGNYLDLEVYARPQNEMIIKRAKRVKESTPAQKKLNDKKSRRQFTRTVHLNFSEEDLFVDCTYEGREPKSREEVLNDIKNFVARLRYRRKKKDLPPLKYLYVISNVNEYGEVTRYHVHLVINKMDRDAVEACWGKGYCNTDRMQFDECGVTARAEYMSRQGVGYKSWGGSVGLIKPEPVVSDKALTKRDVEYIARNPEDRQYFEKKYPGWIFTDCEVSENMFTGISLYIRMRRYPYANRRAKGSSWREKSKKTSVKKAV